MYKIAQTILQDNYCFRLPKQQDKLAITMNSLNLKTRNVKQ